MKTADDLISYAIRSMKPTPDHAKKAIEMIDRRMLTSQQLLDLYVLARCYAQDETRVAWGKAAKHIEDHLIGRLEAQH